MCCRMCNCWTKGLFVPLQHVAGGQGGAPLGACKVVGEGSQLCSTTCPSPLLPLISAPSHPHLAWSYIPQLSQALTIPNLLL